MFILCNKSPSKFFEITGSISLVRTFPKFGIKIISAVFRPVVFLVAVPLASCSNSLGVAPLIDVVFSGISTRAFLFRHLQHLYLE